MEYILAYDLGTSGVKAVLVDCEGRIAGTAVQHYPLYTPCESWAEQDPEDYWKGVCAATRRVLEQTDTPADDVLGLSFCSQWKGIIPLDKDHNVLHNSIIWLDARAAQEAHRLNKILQVNYFKEKLLGFKPSSKLNAAMGREILCAADYWPKLMWFKENLPDLYAKTAVILECNSYVKWRATGEMAVDMTNHFTQSFTPATQGFYNLILKLAKVNPALFPKIVLPTDVVGAVTQEAAGELGVAAGTPVFGGCGDIPAISVGSGSGELGDTHAYFGSSGWLSSMVRCEEGFLSTSPFSKENDLLCFGLQAIGLAFDWAVRQFYGAEWDALGSGVYDLIELECGAVEPGSGGLLATHWLFGERPPFFSDKARGAFVNVNNTHGRAHMVNAVMESVCYSMRLALDALREGTRREVPAIHVVGGCAASAHWMQMLADVLGIPVRVPENPRHAGAIGAAYCALIGLGRCRDFSEAKSRVRMQSTYEPRSENAAVYDKMCAAYAGLYKSLEDTFAALK